MEDVYYIWEESLSGNFHGMKKEDYDKVIWDAHKKLTFPRANGFTSLDDVEEYIKKYSDIKNIVRL